MPPLTTEIKRKVLSENVKRIVGLDVDGMLAQSKGDEFSDRSELAAPWTGGRVAAGAPA